MSNVIEQTKGGEEVLPGFQSPFLHSSCLLLSLIGCKYLRYAILPLSMSWFESPTRVQNQLVPILLQTWLQYTIRGRLHGILEDNGEDSRVWVIGDKALRRKKWVRVIFRIGLFFVGFCEGSTCAPYFGGAIGRHEVFAPAVPVFLDPQDMHVYKYYR